MQDTKLLSELNSGLTQMMKIAGKGFKIAMINMLKDNTQDQIGNFSIKVKKINRKIKFMKGNLQPQG